MSLAQLDLAGLNKVEASINILLEQEPPEGYYLAFSGGKDSVVLYDIAVRAGVKFDAHYHASPIDPPDLIKFIREYYPQIDFEKPKVNFWREFQKRGFPLRTKRWCCEFIKEWGGNERIVITGLRGAESAKRKRRSMIESQIHKTRWGKPRMLIHPIILWSDYDVWEYIKSEDISYCSLYDEGFERVGCVMCPLTTTEKRKREMERFPKTALAWRNNFYRLYENKKDKFKDTWSSGEELFQWWLNR